MAALLFAIPILLFYIFIKKREPSQSEFGFWLLFLIPIGLTFALWLEGESYNWVWWVYLVCWISAIVVLLEEPFKKKFGHDA